MVLLIGFLIIGVWAREIRVNNIHTCEKYWNEDCSGYNVQTKECSCESGVKKTTQEMIENYNQFVEDANKQASDEYWGEKTKDWNEINLTELII